MTRFARWLPAITQTPVIRRSALTAAGLAFVGGAVAGPAIAANAAPATSAAPASVTVAQDSHDNHDKGGKRDDSKRDDSKRDDNKHGKPAVSAKELNVKYEAQPNFYYCGPASTRIALTAAGHVLSQDDVAHNLGTTEEGTNSAEDTTRVLNSIVGGNFYHTTSIRGDKASPADMDRLQADVKRAVNNDRAMVANIKGTANDTDGNPHSYEGGHYVAVVGYRDDGRAVKISDPANPAQSSYWVSTIDMANWMATRGYSS